MADGFVPLENMSTSAKMSFQYLHPELTVRKTLEENVSVEKKKDFELIWEGDLDNYKEDKEWIIDQIIPSRSVGVWTGKRSTYKTFIVLNAIFSIASGLPFLGRFQTKKGKIIYLDKENGIPVIKTRKNMIKKSLEIEEPLDVGFICFSTLKIDKITDIKALEELIVQHKPSILVIDTYRRGISFEENDAGMVSRLFVDILRPLVEKHNISIILIHHDRKGMGQGDEMDEIRGSSDLANYADFILKNERKGKHIILKQLKMRNSTEHAPIEIDINTDEHSYIDFNSSGDYTPQTKDEKCAEQLMIWIMKDKKKEFTTKEAQEEAFRLGIKETNFKYGLQILQDRNIIKKKERGYYEVTAENAKLFV